MSDKRPIGIFDSGLGGLTVAKEIMKAMPNESIVYFGDTGRVPYGTRSDATIARYAKEDEHLLLQNDVKLIIAACGTVSSVAAHTAKDLPVPFFEVVTAAAKKAAEISKNGKIGVIGTGATIKSSAHKKVIMSVRKDAEVFECACTLFVPLVEEGWIERDNPVVINTVKRYLEPIKNAGVDTLILGCTHYPILKDVISDVMGKEVTLINMGETAALQVKQYVEKNSLQTTDDNERYVRYLLSDRTASFNTVARVLLGENISDDCVEQVDMKI